MGKYGDARPNESGRQVSIRTVTRPKRSTRWRVEADICVVGAGISGISAALEAARLGRKVALVDGLPALGGQAVNSIIGTFCGLYSNGPEPYQLTHGIADDILRDLGAKGALHYARSPMTTVVYYDEIALSRWVEESVRSAGIQVLVGAILRRVKLESKRITELSLATRYGDVTVAATGFVDASGDAALVYEAGLPCRQPNLPIYGTQMVVLENLQEDKQVDYKEVSERLRTNGDAYGLLRKDGFAFFFPGRGTAALNMTHVETPLEPIAANVKMLEGKRQADQVVEFLKAEFPDCYGKAHVRAYGLPGIRQTRWIVGCHQLTEAEVRAGTRFSDAIGRTGWPIELHYQGDHLVWHPSADEPLHYIPLGSMVPPDVHNVVAAGRCIDGDAAALSSVRVMGPCIAMGAAAAHALDLAGKGSVHRINIHALQKRLAQNLEDPAPAKPADAADD